MFATLLPTAFSTPTYTQKVKVKLSEVWLPPFVQLGPLFLTVFRSRVSHLHKQVNYAHPRGMLLDCYPFNYFTLAELHLQPICCRNAAPLGPRFDYCLMSFDVDRAVVRKWNALNVILRLAKNEGGNSVSFRLARPSLALLFKLWSASSSPSASTFVGFTKVMLQCCFDNCAKEKSLSKVLRVLITLTVLRGMLCTFRWYTLLQPENDVEL